MTAGYSCEDAAPVKTISPLTSLEHDERKQVIDALTTHLPASAAITVLTALAGSRAEVEAAPIDLQERTQRAILAALPPGLNAIAVSTLGIPSKSDEDYLEEVLSEQEKSDASFRQQVEEEARRRGIQRWLAAARLRQVGMSVDEVAATVEQTQRARTAGEG